MVIGRGRETGGEVSGNRRGKRAPHETGGCLTNAE